jgi:hypothetical protein
MACPCPRRVGMAFPKPLIRKGKYIAGDDLERWLRLISLEGERAYGEANWKRGEKERAISARPNMRNGWLELGPTKYEENLELVLVGIGTAAGATWLLPERRRRSVQVRSDGVATRSQDVDLT